MSATVYVSLGSNVEPEINIHRAVQAMREMFGSLRLSPVYQSAAVGFDGDDFLNLVVGFETGDSVHGIVASSRLIEDNLGRDRSQPRYSPRPIDLDILLFGDLVIDEPAIQIPRRDIVKQAFVLLPLQDLAGDSRHPQLRQTYAELWQQMAPRAPRLAAFELALD